jgi:hypothetical protein
MILDAQLLFTGGTAPPGTTLTICDLLLAQTNSTNTLDLAIGQTNTAGGLPLSSTSPNNQPIRDLGIGDDPALKILVQAIVNPSVAWAPGTASIAVGLQGAPDSGTGTVGSFSSAWYTSTAVLGSTINATPGGARLMDMDMPRPPDGVAIPRYLRLSYTITGGPFTGTGNLLLATLVLDRADQIYNATNNVIWGGYPPGVVVAN